MQLFILLGLVACAWARTDSFIVGGTAAPGGAYPWQCGLYAGGSFSCGAVVMHASWVLTAAHCVQGAGYTLECGTNSRGSGQRFNIVGAPNDHPQYDSPATPGAFPNDLAVLQVSGITNGNTIQAVPGGLTGVNDHTGRQCFISGWGRTCGACALPVALQHTQISAISNAQCTGQWGNNYNANVHQCVWESGSQDVGSCNGDSGGPLVCRNGAGAFDLVGVTSWGATGCPTSSPSVYTRLFTFTAWICTNTNNQVC